jgi:hypothetical protein
LRRPTAEHPPSRSTSGDVSGVDASELKRSRSTNASWRRCTTRKLVHALAIDRMRTGGFG